MNFNDWDVDGDLPDEMDAAEAYRRSDAEELLAINWRLILQIERQYQEQQELAREFDEELDALFALIHTPEPAEDGLPDPPGWPDL
jgi:hypothetical protein